MFSESGREHIEIIVIVVPMGILADVTVRLAIDTAAFMVTDPFFQTVACTIVSLLCSSIDRNSISRQGKVPKIDQPFLGGTVKKKDMEDLKDAFTGIYILRRIFFKLPEKSSAVTLSTGGVF